MSAIIIIISSSSSISSSLPSFTPHSSLDSPSSSPTVVPQSTSPASPESVAVKESTTPPAKRVNWQTPIVHQPMEETEVARKELDVDNIFAFTPDFEMLEISSKQMKQKSIPQTPLSTSSSSLSSSLSPVCKKIFVIPAPLMKSALVIKSKSLTNMKVHQ